MKKSPVTLEPKKRGRRPRVVGERRRATAISLGDSEKIALRELSELLDESQGAIVGRLVHRELARERRKRELA